MLECDSLIGGVDKTLLMFLSFSSPPGLVDKVGRILLNGSEGVGGFDETEVGLPLGGVGHDVSGAGVDELPLLRNDGEILSNKS